MENTKISKLKMLGYSECVKSYYSVLIKENKTLIVAEDGNSIEIDTRKGVDSIRETQFSNGLKVITINAEENTEELKVNFNGERRTSVGVTHAYFKGKELNDGVYETEFSRYKLKVISSTELANTYYLELELTDKNSGKSIKRSVDFGEYSIFITNRLDSLTPFYSFLSDNIEIQIVNGSTLNNAIILLPAFIINLKRNVICHRNVHNKIIEDIDTGEIYELESSGNSYKITNLSIGKTQNVDRMTAQTVTFGKVTIRYKLAVIESHKAKDTSNEQVYYFSKYSMGRM